MDSQSRIFDDGELLVSSSQELRQKTREIHKILTERNKKLRQDQRRQKNFSNIQSFPAAQVLGSGQWKVACQE